MSKNKKWNLKKVGDENPNRVLFYYSFKRKADALLTIKRWNEIRTTPVELVYSYDDKNWERA